LKSLLKEPAFAGPRCQIVDQDGTIHYGPIAVERNVPMSVGDLAKSFGVPVLDPRHVGLPDEASRHATRMSDAGYTPQAIHEGDGKPAERSPAIRSVPCQPLNFGPHSRTGLRADGR
jgi:hypothetical protein